MARFIVFTAALASILTVVAASQAVSTAPREPTSSTLECPDCLEATSTDSSPPRALLLCFDCSSAQLEALSESIAERGGHMMILTPPDSALVRIPQDVSKALAGEYPGLEVHYGLVDDRLALSLQSRALLKYWNRSLQDERADLLAEDSSATLPPDYNEHPPDITANTPLAQHRSLESTAPTAVRKIKATSKSFLSSVLSRNKSVARDYLAPHHEAPEAHSVLDTLLEQAQRSDHALDDFEVAVTEIKDQTARALIVDRTGAPTAELQLRLYGLEWLIVGILP